MPINLNSNGEYDKWSGAFKNYQFTDLQVEGLKKYFGSFVEPDLINLISAAVRTRSAQQENTRIFTSAIKGDNLNKKLIVSFDLSRYLPRR